MKTKIVFHFRGMFIISCLILLNAGIVNAQYCSPTFSYGCITWSNQALTRRMP
jgi:hypothetical protein